MQDQDAFNKKKAAVTSNLCLALIGYTDKRKELFLYTDSSLVAFRGVLIVKDAKG